MEGVGFGALVFEGSGFLGLRLLRFIEVEAVGSKLQVLCTRMEFKTPYRSLVASTFIAPLRAPWKEPYRSPLSRLKA